MSNSGKDSVSTQLGALSCAFRFLTLIPVRWQESRDGDLFPLSVNYFPLVGVTIGAAAVLLCTAAGTVFPPIFLSFLVVTFLSAISGFLHLDGLADSGDGLLSHRSRERSLEIMKDSRIGSMGVVGILLVLLGKFSALSSLSLSQICLAAFLMPIAGRVSIVITMAFFPYARPEGGLGALFYSAGMKKAAAMALLLLLMCSMLTNSVMLALLVVFSILLLIWLFAQFCKKRIGGVTGDTLGAICELSEAVTAVVICGYFF